MPSLVKSILYPGGLSQNSKQEVHKRPQETIPKDAGVFKYEREKAFMSIREQYIEKQSSQSRQTPHHSCSPES
jgi:predicted phage gp36 major capsid-like protein